MLDSDRRKDVAKTLSIIDFHRALELDSLYIGDFHRVEGEHWEDIKREMEDHDAVLLLNDGDSDE